jgi:hypothetical protein
MATAAPSRPKPSEHHAYYATYISEVPEGNVLATLAAQIDRTSSRLAAVPESKAGFRYAEGKWSIKEVIGHVADTERVFTYRALRIARGDTTPLPGFDENAWVPFGEFDRRTLADITADLRAVRAGTLRRIHGGGMAPDGDGERPPRLGAGAGVDRDWSRAAPPAGAGGAVFPEGDGLTNQGLLPIASGSLHGRGHMLSNGPRVPGGAHRGAAWDSGRPGWSVSGASAPREPGKSGT